MKSSFIARRVDSMGIMDQARARGGRASFGSVMRSSPPTSVARDAAAVEGARDAHRAGEAARAALDEVIAAGARRPGQSAHFSPAIRTTSPLSRTRTDVRRRRRAGPCRISDGLVGFEDVERRHAVAGAAVRRPPEAAAQLLEQPPDVVGEVAELGRVAGRKANRP